jgi:hypothetical protein
MFCMSFFQRHSNSIIPVCKITVRLSAAMLSYKETGTNLSLQLMLEFIPIHIFIILFCKLIA